MLGDKKNRNLYRDAKRRSESLSKKIELEEKLFLMNGFQEVEEYENKKIADFRNFHAKRLREKREYPQKIKRKPAPIHPEIGRYMPIWEEIKKRNKNKAGSAEWEFSGY
ncbi:hypothetical protein ACFLZZ_02265 [Nanoarchaeota archaeon]